MRENWTKSEWLAERAAGCRKIGKTRIKIGKPAVITFLITIFLIAVMFFVLGGNYGIVYAEMAVIGFSLTAVFALKKICDAGGIHRSGNDKKKGIMYFGAGFFEKLALNEAELEDFDKEMRDKKTVDIPEGGTVQGLNVYVSEKYIAYECLTFGNYDCLICRLRDVYEAKVSSLGSMTYSDKSQKMYVTDLQDSSGKRIMAVQIDGNELYAMFYAALKEKAPYIRL